MTSYPEQRFARLRLSVEQHPAATFTLTAAAPGAKPSPQTHPALAKIAETDSARATLIGKRLQNLIGREPEVFAWLEKDAANTALFLKDPAAALKIALGDLPADFFEGWRG